VNLAAALKDGCDNRLAFGPTSGNLPGLFRFVHVARLPTDEGFINLDFAT